MDQADQGDSDSNSVVAPFAPQPHKHPGAWQHSALEMRMKKVG